MTEKSIIDVVKEAKADIKAKAKSRNSECCPIEYEGDGEIKNIHIEIAENGFLVQANYNGKVIAKTAKEAGEAVTEFLS